MIVDVQVVVDLDGYVQLPTYSWVEWSALLKF